MRTLALLSLLSPLAAWVGLAAAPASAAGLTSAQVVQRCRSAYGALRTYQVTVTAVSAGARGQTYHTSADIKFQRPGRIRASGTSMFGSQYAYVSDGGRTGQTMGGRWRRAASPEMAIAGATGIAMSAATTVPALLLHTRWGDPFPRAQTLAPAPTLSAVDGHPCYHVSASGPAGSEVYWIDRKTFLLRRYIYSSSFATLRQDQHFTRERLNAPLPPATFALPPGAS